MPNTPPKQTNSTDERDQGRIADGDVRPNHYVAAPMSCGHCGHQIELIDVIRNLDFLSGNVIKYVVRAPYKGNRLADLRKAGQYIDWLIEDAEKTKN